MTISVSGKIRLSKLCIDEFNIGDEIMFCPNCTFQNPKGYTRNWCDICNNNLHVIELSEELININSKG